MKWYFGINEQGVSSDAGHLARLAVISAQRNTDLKPHLLYRGERNRFTAWMEDRGVTVIDTLPQFEPVLRRAINGGWYPSGLTGHWLRTEICHIEQQDEFVLYTDVDVIFLRSIDLGRLRPRFFACAPETRIDERTHFSSGVMLMNVPALRADYPRLRATIEARFLEGPRVPFHDQAIYNSVYAGQWDLLDPVYNWKPYWAANPSAAIFHFHGPKVDAIRAMIDGKWAWEDESGYGLKAGEMIATMLPNYLVYLEVMRDLLEPGDRFRLQLEGVLRDAPAALPRLRAEWERYRKAAEGLDLEPDPVVLPAPPGSGVAIPSQLLATDPTGWQPDGMQAWVRRDRRAYVFQDAGAWVAALRHPAPGRVDPDFVTDAVGRIVHFPTVLAAQEACDRGLAAG